jgi:hypothetical protein
VLFGLRAAAHSILGNTDAGLNNIIRLLLGNEAIGGSLAAPIYASRIQAHLNSGARYAVGFRECIFRLALEVAFRKFLGINAHLFDGGLASLVGLDGLAFGSRTEQSATLQGVRKSLLGSVPAGSADVRRLASNVVFDRVLEVRRRTGWSGHVYNLQTQTGWYSANGIITHNCVAVPVFVIDGEVIMPPMRGAQDWLAEQPEGVQQEVMGPTRWAAWKRGDVQLSDMAQYRPNERFGGAWVPRNVRDIVDRNPLDRVTLEAQQRSVHQIVA